MPGATPALTYAMEAALAAQRAACFTVPYAVSLHVAALRRAAREYVSRSYPLGSGDAGEYGVMRVGRDYLIGELEADYRRPPFDTAPAPDPML